MLSEAKFKTVARWAQELSEADRDLARRNMSEKLLPKGAYLLHENDHVDAWFGVIDGLLKICVVAENGEAITLTGISSSGWVGEGSVIKNEPRRYDVVALRPIEPNQSASSKLFSFIRLSPKKAWKAMVPISSISFSG